MNLFKAIWMVGKDPQYRHLAIAALSTLGSGTLVFHLVEGWDWLDSLYFCVVALTTVGFGDYSPQTHIGKLFAIFYILGGVGILVTFVHVVATKRTAGKKQP